ncbi:MAG: aldehyde dehydrogenase family protein [Flavobacteriales bacterium]|nr:aldehyde dehydrogenase family protein [Flavobacteriales bacterium]
MSQTLKSINPWNKQLVFEINESSEKEVEQSLMALDKSFQQWKSTPVITRCAYIMAVAAKLKRGRDDYARMMSREMGKPLAQAKAEIDKCAWLCEHHAKHAPIFLADEVIQSNAKRSFVRHQGSGVILALMPWNYPFWQVFRAAVPAILSGNAMVLKHASNVSGSSKALEELFNIESFPILFKSVFLRGEKAALVLKNPLVKGLTLTGSEKAGSEMAALAGSLIKPALLELGGSNAMIITADANIEQAVEQAVKGRFQNNGQSCIAVKRLIVDERHYEEVKERLEAKLKSMFTGDPLEDPDLGPMAREDLAIELEEQCICSLEQGAKAMFPIKREASLFFPNVLMDCSPGMKAWDEELFGPVLALCSFNSFDEAIALSNHNRFGLGVSIMCNNPEMYLSRCAEFEEGAVFFNSFVKSDPNLPFGGVNASGFGRELAKDGFMSFVNRQTIVIE